MIQLKIEMVLLLLAGRAAGAQYRPSHRPVREQREASLHVRLPRVQQTLLQALQFTAAQSQTHR